MKEENNFYCENYNNDGFADIEEKCKKQCENCKTKAIQSLSQSKSKPITKEEIEYRIKEEFKKHKELDWAKIAASKIYALLPHPPQTK